MSPKFEKVKKYYDSGLWNKTMVRNAVVKGWITAEEFEEITGEIYDGTKSDDWKMGWLNANQSLKLRL